MPVVSWAVLSTGLSAAFITVRRGKPFPPTPVISQTGKGKDGPRKSVQTLGDM